MWIKWAWFLAWLLVFGELTLSTDREVLFARINDLHHPVMDVLMRVATWWGDGIWMIVLLAAYLLWNRKFPLGGFLVFVISGATVQVLKTWFFKSTPRPAAFFGEQLSKFHLPAHDTLYTLDSFPSGHTTTAWGLAFWLCMIDPRPWRQVVYLSLSTLTGISRIYLGQHWPLDVLAGSCIGVGISAIVFPILLQWRKTEPPLKGTAS